MAEYHRLPRAPVLEVDLCAVLRGDRGGHGPCSLLTIKGDRRERAYVAGHLEVLGPSLKVLKGWVRRRSGHGRTHSNRTAWKPGFGRAPGPPAPARVAMWG